MTTSSTTYVNKQVPRFLADKVMMAATPVGFLLGMANMYSLVGMPGKVKRLNRYGDIGRAAAGTEGTTFSTVTDFSMQTPVDITTSEGAVVLANITNAAIEETGLGYANALELFDRGSTDEIVSVLFDEALMMNQAVIEKVEYDLAQLFASATNTVGALTNDLSLSVVEQAIFTADTLEQRNENRAFCLSPRGVSDLRRESQVTSGGVQGVIWAGQQELKLQSGNSGLAGSLWGVPVYQFSQTLAPTSGTVPGSGGHIGALICVGSGNPEDQGGSGIVGALQYVEKTPVSFSSQFVVRDRAIDFMANHRYGVALRAQDLIVGLLHDDA